ncbi:hypothetical protein BC826DRAFT_917423, partial [Russula brevipes]
SYEPELFPGLIYRMIKPKVILLIFVSGKIVLIGNEGYEYHSEDSQVPRKILTDSCISAP